MTDNYKIINASALVEMLRQSIEKNPTSGTYLVFDKMSGAAIVLSTNAELNKMIHAWFDLQVRNGNAAFKMGEVPNAIKDTELQ